MQCNREKKEIHGLLKMFCFARRFKQLWTKGTPSLSPVKSKASGGLLTRDLLLHLGQEQVYNMSGREHTLHAVF